MNDDEEESMDDDDEESMSDDKEFIEINKDLRKSEYTLTDWIGVNNENKREGKKGKVM